MASAGFKWPWQQEQEQQRQQQQQPQQQQQQQVSDAGSDTAAEQQQSQVSDGMSAVQLLRIQSLSVPGHLAVAAKSNCCCIIADGFAFQCWQCGHGRECRERQRVDQPMVRTAHQSA